MKKSGIQPTKFGQLELEIAQKVGPRVLASCWLENLPPITCIRYSRIYALLVKDSKDMDVDKL